MKYIKPRPVTIQNLATIFNDVTQVQADFQLNIL